MKKGTKPKLEIDLDEVERLANRGLTNDNFEFDFNFDIDLNWEDRSGFTSKSWFINPIKENIVKSNYKKAIDMAKKVDSLKNLVDGGFVDKITICISNAFYCYERQHKNGLIPYLYKLI